MIQTDALTLARQIRTKEISPIALVDAVLRRIEALQPTVNAFITVTAAVKAHTAPIRLEVTRAQYDELCLQYGTHEGIRMYRGKPVVIAPEFRWVTE